MSSSFVRSTPGAFEFALAAHKPVMTTVEAQTILDGLIYLTAIMEEEATRKADGSTDRHSSQR